MSRNEGDGIGGVARANRPTNFTPRSLSAELERAQSQQEQDTVAEPLTDDDGMLPWADEGSSDSGNLSANSPDLNQSSPSPDAEDMTAQAQGGAATARQEPPAATDASVRQEHRRPDRREGGSRSERRATNRRAITPYSQRDPDIENRDPEYAPSTSTTRPENNRRGSVNSDILKMR